MQDRIISHNHLQRHRLTRQWSQAELAERAGISRAAVSAIEGDRLSPSVATALALAEVLDCIVEELFGQSKPNINSGPRWAWKPRTKSSRYWEAEVAQQRLLYSVEETYQNPIPHDGTLENGVFRERPSISPEKTLTIATCDPAAALLAAEYARATGFRLLAFPRSGARALELLRQGLIHVAALHRSTTKHPERNAETVRERLDGDFQLLRVAEWEEGLVLPPENSSRSAMSVARRTRCWASREPGSAARECLDEFLQGRAFVGRDVAGHTSVAEAVRSGWAGAGVCVRISADEAGLHFLPLRTESLDFCFSARSQRDPRIQALIRLLRSRGYRQLLSELPGYNARQTGQLSSV